MKITLLLLLFVVSVAFAADLQIEVQHKPTDCTQKSKAGDKLKMHYTVTTEPVRQP